MNKIAIVLLFVLFNCFPSSAQTTLNFNDGWKFHFGNASNPAKDFNYGIGAMFNKANTPKKTAFDSNFNDGEWDKVSLPHDWVVTLPFESSSNFDVAQHGYKPVGGLYPATSIGWYRKHFTIAAKDSGQRFQIQFDGVFRDANFWINGFYLGNHKSGYTGVTYDITDFLNYDKDNVVVVRADATQYEGWFYEGAGIYRNVWLKKNNPIHIAQDGIFIYSKQKGNTATIYNEIEVENINALAAPITVQTLLIDRNGLTQASSMEQPIVIGTHALQVVKQNLQISGARLWSLQDPYLYRVAVVIKQNGKVIERVTNRFGIRTIEIKTNGVFVNGQYTKIHGTNNHPDHAGVGTAMPDYLQYYRTRLLKEMGCNSIRTSHYPPTPELLDACDSLGILVLDENRLVNSGAEYTSQFIQLLKRDRSRTSVFLWSIGNEEGGLQTSTIGKRVAQTLLQLQQSLDPTRTATYAADVANVFKGINEVIPVRGFNYREYAVADYHKAHPLQPILGTEMGSTVTTRGIYVKDTINCYVPDKDVTAPWWASTAEAWWKPAAVNDFWLGGYIWTGFDYRGEPTPYEWPNISSHFGVMDVCGFPKNLYYYYQSWWTDKDVLHILPHWNWSGKEGQPIDVWVYSNAQNVELFLNGKSLGKKEMPLNGHLQWTVNYEPGILKAVAFKNGKTFTAKNETTGKPAGIVVSPSKTTMLSDGRDATIINISVVDKKGREVPDAQNLIHLSIKGDGKIIGTGNGDPSCHEADQCASGKWQRSLFNGKCQFIIQAGTTPSNIQIEATGDSLWSGSTEVFTIPSQIVSVQKKPSLTNLKPVKKQIGKMLGADISFLQQLEEKGIQFSDKGVKQDAIEILKAHGFNYIRLRIFNNPALDSVGYSPKKGYCDLAHTLAFAKRIKAAGMNFLLDFHYSDTWADPGKQYKPTTWKNIPFELVQDSLYNFTKQVMTALVKQGTAPDMVQIGNEINHGMVWPDGHVRNFDGLAQLYKAGADAVINVAPNTIIMLHIALGGQNDESVSFIDNMLARGVQFDVIGESYYPQWHGTLNDLKSNLNDLIVRYDKDVVVVEYSSFKQEVNDIVFNLPNGKGKGSFIWEPLSTWEAIFDKSGQSNDYINIYDDLQKKYLPK
jgi:beta-galactosidase